MTMVNHTREALERAQILLQSGDVQAARQVLEPICAREDGNARAWLLLGACEGRQGQSRAAVDCFRRAIYLAPGTGVAHYNLAIALHGLNELEEAAGMCRQAVDLQPGHAGFHYELGCILANLGKPEEAAASFERVLDLDSANANAHVSLGVLLVKTGRFEEALGHYRNALDIQPDSLQAIVHSAEALQHLGRHEEALAAARQAIAMGAEGFYPYKILGEALLALGRYRETLSVLQDATDKFANVWEFYSIIGRACLELGDEGQAMKHFQEACRLNPESEMTRYYIDQLQGVMTSSSGAARYVRDIFDKYADHFDDHLVKTLKYQVPWLVESLIRRELSAATGTLAILDLGCGTGLCGPLIADLKERLVGIDLSHGMIAKADQRGVYDELIAGEIVEEMSHLDTGFDLVIAADVFVYIRDLGPVFAAIRRVLKTGGLFVFTLELAASGESGPRSSGRVVHDLAYTRALADSNHFEELEMREEILRVEGSNLINGVIIALRKLVI